MIYHPFHTKPSGSSGDITQNRDNRLGQKQHEHLKGGVNWPVPFRLAYFMAVGLLIWVGYAEHLEQAGEESKVPAVVDKVEEIQQAPTAEKLPASEPGGMPPGGMPFGEVTPQDIVQGRAINLLLIFSNIGIRDSRSGHTEQFEFLRQLIFDKLGYPPYRGTKEEWDAYVDRLYGLDIDRWLA